MQINYFALCILAVTTIVSVLIAGYFYQVNKNLILLAELSAKNNERQAKQSYGLFEEMLAILQPVTMQKLQPAIYDGNKKFKGRPTGSSKNAD